MSLIPLTCPLCKGVFQVDSAHAGSDVACPLCAKTVRLPKELATPAKISASDPPVSPTAPPSPAPATPVEPSQATFSFPAPPPMPGVSAAPSAPSPSEPPTVNRLPAAPPEAATAPPATRDAPPNPTAAPPIAETPVKPNASESQLPRLTCSRCENLFRVPLDSAGGQVHCPICNAIVDVPNVLVETPDVEVTEGVVAPEFQFAEPDESADETVERGGIRHLSREERAQARARKNLFMLVLGFLLLFGSIFLLQRYETFFMDLWEKSGFAPPEEEL